VAFAAQHDGTACQPFAENVDRNQRPAESGARVAGAVPNSAQAAVLLFQRALDHDHISGWDLVLGDVRGRQPGIIKDRCLVSFLQVLTDQRCCRRYAGLA
jgi:hypothetical protein